MVSPESKDVIHVPQGVTVTITGSTLKVKGKAGELARSFPGQGITVKKEGNDVVVHADLPRKKTRALVGTYAANIEQATIIRGFDPRVFQDGIYITVKGV